MSTPVPSSQISSVGELLAHAYQMELEAQERYSYLAEQMDVHNNTGLAGLFRKLSEIEGIHARDILQQMQEMSVSQLASADDKWAGDEAPETVDMGDVSYMMTPRQALQLALEAERRAQKFFDQLRVATRDKEVERFAAEFAEEEREHVDLVLAELAKYPASDEDTRDDMDPPVAQG
jgi:rubrerythrin